MTYFLKSLSRWWYFFSLTLTIRGKKSSNHNMKHYAMLEFSEDLHIKKCIILPYIQ